MSRAYRAELLLACLRGAPPSSQATLNRFDSGQWQELAQAAVEHALGPLLYERLTAGPDPANIPDDLLQNLREAFLKNGTRNLLLYQDLAEALRVLQQDGMPVIVLKGAHLAALVYPQMALRFVGDIDLLVHQTDLARTTQRLQRVGYAFDATCDPKAWSKRRELSHLPPLFKPPHPRIEVHWRINSIHPPDGQPDLWSRACRARLGGVETLVLAPEDLILHLCLHGAGQHLFSLGLRSVCDLRAVIERHAEAIRWDLLISGAREWQAQKSIYLALNLARELVTAPVPPLVLEQLRPTDLQPRWLAAANERILEVAESQDAEGEVELLTFNTLSDLSTQGSRAGNHGSLLRMLFPPRQYMARYMVFWYSLPLTPMRRWTCYLTRMMDWLGRVTSPGSAWFSTSSRGRSSHSGSTEQAGVAKLAPEQPGGLRPEDAIAGRLRQGKGPTQPLMKNTFIAILLVTTVVFGGLYFQQRHNVNQAKAGAEALPQKAVEPQATASESRSGSSAQPSPEGTSLDLAAPSQVQAETSSVPQPMSTSTSPFAEALRNPEMKEMVRNAEKTLLSARIERDYSQLFSELHLNPERAATLRDLILNKQLAAAEAGLSVLANESAAGNRAALVQRFKSANAAADAQLRAFLGEEELMQFRAYQVTMVVRKEVGGFKDQLGSGANAISEDQERQLIQALAQERREFKFTKDLPDESKSPRDPGALLTGDRMNRRLEELGRLNERYLARAQSVLSPKQLTIFQRYLSAQ